MANAKVIGGTIAGLVLWWVAQKSIEGMATKDDGDRGDTGEPPDPGTGIGGVSVDVDDFGVHYAEPRAGAVWPLPSDSRERSERYASGSYVWARRRVTEDFGDPRPFMAANPTRHHAGEDLRGARGAIVVATEPGVIATIDRDWYKTNAGEVTGMVLVQHDSGITIAYGEIDPASVLVHEGDRVIAGQPLGSIGATEMLHLEIYRGAVRRTWQWPWDGPVPDALLDPTRYLRAAAPFG